MIRKSKRASHTVAYVPLTGKEGVAGALFIQSLKKYLNRAGWRVLVRGRNEDRAGTAKASGLHRGAFHQDVPLANSTYAAVYLQRTKASTTLEVQREWYEWATKEINKLHVENIQIADFLRKAEATNKDLCKELENSKPIIAQLKQFLEARQPSWALLWSDLKMLLARAWVG
jgi:hypothetical protein